MGSVNYKAWDPTIVCSTLTASAVQKLIKRAGNVLNLRLREIGNLLVLTHPTTAADKSLKKILRKPLSPFTKRP
jgi:hypothetical protein